MRHLCWLTTVTLVCGVVALSACKTAPSAEQLAQQTAQSAAVMQTAVEKIKLDLTQTALNIPTATVSPTKAVPTFGLVTSAAATPEPPESPAGPVTPAPAQILPTLPNLPGTAPAALMLPTLPGLPAVPLTPQPGSATQAAPSGVDKAEYANDTIKDGTTFAPGAAFTQTWTLQNTGTSTWSSDYSVAFVKGDQMGAPDSVRLSNSISPDMVVNIAVPMVAPKKPGTYRGEWTIKNARGEPFGLGTTRGNFWIEITVSN